MGLEHFLRQMQQLGMGGDDMPQKYCSAYAVIEKPGDFLIIRLIFPHVLQRFRQKPQSICTCSDVVKILHFLGHVL